jgi:hypothetical protein
MRSPGRRVLARGGNVFEGYLGLPEKDPQRPSMTMAECKPETSA